MKKILLLNSIMIICIAICSACVGYAIANSQNKCLEVSVKCDKFYEVKFGLSRVNDGDTAMININGVKTRYLNVGREWVQF